MIEYIKSLFDFVNLTAHQQVIWMMGLLIIIGSMTTLHFYKKNEKSHTELKRKSEHNEKMIIILQNEKNNIRDSLYGVIYNLKLQELTYRLNKSDSLLTESQKLKNSISPIIKKLNKQIENIN